MSSKRVISLLLSLVLVLALSVLPAGAEGAFTDVPEDAVRKCMRMIISD